MTPNVRVGNDSGSEGHGDKGDNSEAKGVVVYKLVETVHKVAELTEDRMVGSQL